jgi:hypothetical protein
MCAFCASAKLQVVSLAECGTHARVAAALGSCRTGEREPAAGLAGPADEDMLITADCGFYSWQLRDLFAATGAALCRRAGASVPLPLVRRLPDGSHLALIFAPGATATRKAALLAAARAGEQTGQDQARIVRAAEYTVPDRGGEDSEPICVITTLLDPAALTAAEMATCPRVIKRARHNSYRVKRPSDIAVTHTSPPTIKLEGLPAAA